MSAKDTDSCFEKSFFSIPEKSLMRGRFNKSFTFSIYSPLFKKADEVFAFCVSKEFNSILHVPQGAARHFEILF